MCKIFCGSKDCEECFERSFASHPKAGWWSDRNELKSYEVLKKSGKKFEFKCDTCYHYFSSALYSFSDSKRGCPFCYHQKLCENEDCKLCFEKSFASHEKSKYLSDKTINPRLIFKKSNSKYYFDCNICNHTFSTALNNISHKNPRWCPFCSHQKLCGNKHCFYCFENSFASNEKSKYMIDKIDPITIALKSDKSFNFECGNCLHIFKSDPNHISRGKWCPYCCWPRSKICKDTHCKHCKTRTFSTHEKSKYWSENNEKQPSEVFLQSSLKYEFKCDEGHYFKSQLNWIVKGQWCPKCKNKTELKFFDWILTIYPDTIHQYKTEWCMSKRKLPFDFFIPSLNIIIEIDGNQHFKQILNWDNPEYTQSRDLYKMKKAYDNNMTVIRIPYEFIWKDCHFKKYKNKLKEKLYLRDRPEIIYLCDDNRYDHFKNFNFDGDILPEIIPK